MVREGFATEGTIPIVFVIELGELCLYISQYFIEIVITRRVEL